jgi:hypothetical protein
MRKMRLNTDNLVVEGFTTTTATGGRGTVHGHSGAESCTCPVWTEGCEDPGPQTGFDINSATGCNNCVCPNQVGGG